VWQSVTNEGGFMSINKVVISGNLTRDPELRSTPNGTPVLALGVAVNDRRKNQESGQWEDVPNFFDVTVFGARAEALSRFLSKGAKVAIEGRLRWHQWETPQGEKRSKVDIIADEIEFLTSRDGGSGAQYSAPEPAAIDEIGDEIPF
jgi:single-strand DNA-binding protein